MDFGSPYKPYDIQVEFMTKLYDTIDNGNIGIFSSPTGTGKSMSIICATMKWLLDDAQKKKSAQVQVNPCEPTWVTDFATKRKQEELERTLKDKQEQQEKRRKRVAKFQKKRSNFVYKLELNPEDEDILVNFDEKESKATIGLNSSLMQGLYDSSDESEPDLEESDEYVVPKIIYCSRTHTQLDQFIGELKKTKYAQEINVISLTGRQKMCIHPVVSKAGARINEICLDKKQSKDKKKKCQYSDQTSQNVFKDHALNKVRDIEDLVTLGKQLSSCPYYGGRSAIPCANLVVIPYNSLIHKPTRDSLGIKLEECVVIIDEAHNLVDTIIGAHNIEISHTDIQKSQNQLSAYFVKYQNRLAPKNQNRVKQLLMILNAINKFMREIKEKDNNIISLNDFLFSCQLDHINLFEVEEFIVKSELFKKLNGFIEKETKDYQKETNSIYLITSFFLALTNLDKDAKLHIEKIDVCKIKFLLLNPSIYFGEVVEKAKSVVLCGGTMEPMSILIKQLFPSVSKDKITIFGCGHVIPDNQMIVNCVASGPSFQDFDFTFQGRSNIKMVEDVGRYLLMMSRVVPDGMVIFFPSYQYEEFVIETLTKNGNLKKIDAIKRFYREPKSSQMVSQVFSDFKKTIDSKIGNGAILSCVVGGKMSEGINFSDSYARCVIMVGLPYPNPSDPELVEKMAFLDKTEKGAGQQHYESLCMRAVNQSIGRSIRHIKDYACICLLDKRYLNQNIRAQLPNWIQKRITCHDKFGTSLEEIKDFFNNIKV